MTARRAIFDLNSLMFLAFVVAAVGLRILGLQASPLNLHFDEAQYWSWSRTLDWGYFSKPPLIAWAIAATTSIFGNEEWAVRLAAPAAQGLGAIALFALGRSMYGAIAGWFAGIGWLTLPGVWLSSGIISTDALMLPLWSMALLALWRLVNTRAWVWAVALGVILGVGALAKYAMLYFPLCAALAALWVKPAREALLGPRGAAVGLIALAILAPNLYWNTQHDFATVSHTVSNARLSGELFNFDELLEFITGQAAVVGPLLFAGLVFLFWRAGRRASGLADEDRFLLAFILPVLLFIAAQAFISRANANWAAAAYPATVVWLAGSLSIGKRGRRFLAAGIALNCVIGGVTNYAAIDPAFADRAGFANSFKRARGWDVGAEEIAARAMAQPGEAPFTAVLVDDRATYYELAYYWREARRAGAPLPPVRMWLLRGHPGNHAEATDPMRPEEGGRVLIVHETPRYIPLVAGDFITFRAVEQLAIPLGGGKSRIYDISVGEGFAPAVRDAAFEARIP